MLLLNLKRMSKLNKFYIILLCFAGAGCAPAPVLKDPNTSEGIKVSKAFSAPEAAWPAKDWWVKYQDPQLNDLVALALKDSPDIKIASARFAQSAAVSESIGSVLYPQLSGNANATAQEFSGNYLFPPSMTPNGWPWTGQATLNFNWEMDIWGKNRAALSSSVSAAQAALADKEQAKLLISAGVVQTYADLARAYANRDTLEKIITIRQKTVDLFSQRQLHGMETKGAVDQADAKKVLAKNDLVQTDTQIKLLKNKIAALIGKSPDFALEIKRPVIDFNYHYALPKQIDVGVLGRRPDVIAARWIVESKDATIYQRKAEFFPNVNLAAFIGFQSLGLNNLVAPESHYGSAGPAIYLPIFQGGRLRANLASAKAGYAESVANYEKVLVSALQEVADIGVNMRALDEQVSLSNEAVKKATSALMISKSRYEGGLSNYLNVLIAEDELLNMLRIQTDINARAFIYDAALNKALGGGYEYTPDITINEDKRIEEFPNDHP